MCRTQILLGQFVCSTVKRNLRHKNLLFFACQLIFLSATGVRRRVDDVAPTLFDERLMCTCAELIAGNGCNDLADPPVGYLKTN
jgi:hypothetical protein